MKLNTFPFQALAFAVLSYWLCQPSTAAADIYQYTDENGVIHFSNVGVGPGKKVKALKSADATTDLKQTALNTPTPPQEPIVSSNGPDGYADIINTACNIHGVDPALVQALVKVESNFNPDALSKKGAMGLMQLMPQTALEMRVRNTFNPDENINGGVKYLRYLIDRYEGNLSLALAAYNSGETAVKKWGTVPPYRETQNYVQRILKLYQGGEKTFRPRHTIYMGYGEDGVIILTDDPSKHQDQLLKHKTAKNL